MKLGRCSVENFGSYKALEFDFSSLGLSLIYGATGSGKSTLQDIPCWILYGRTAKDGAADDVRSWLSDAPTIGQISVETTDGTIEVVRTRGKGKNDLYWIESEGSDPKRGKDLTETQKLLELRLGTTSEQFQLAAYFHEFSTAAQFFTAKAKDRRAVFERLTNMDLAINLASKASDRKKSTRAELTEAEKAKAVAESRYASNQEQIDKLVQRESNWSEDNARQLAAIGSKLNAWNDAHVKALATLQAERDKESAAQVKRVDDKKVQLAKFVLPDASDLKAQLTEVEGALKALPGEQAKRDAMYASSCRLAATIKAKEKEYNRFSVIKGQCPTCLGAADNVNKTAFLNSVRDEMAKLQTELDALTAQLVDADAGLLDLKELQSYQKELASKIHAAVMLEKDYENVKLQLESLQKNYHNPYDAALRAEESKENPYVEQLARAASAENPYSSQIQDARRDELTLLNAADKAKAVAESLTDKLAKYERLYDLSFDLRGVLLQQAVKTIEDNTNRILESYFDGEIRVGFTLSGGDDLEVEVQKNGYPCSYLQLSKGQRQLLKLAFVVSVQQAAADRVGQTFTPVMYDEALDGLDASLKVKAFRLFEEISTQHDSVLLIDHASELQTMFLTRYRVALNGDASEIMLDEG